MFSIWINGMGDFLNLTPGLGTARFASLRACQRNPSHRPAYARGIYLHSTVPSLRASSRSPAGSRSPRMSSIQARASFAACGVYLPMRSFFMSWSSDVTDAMAGIQGSRLSRVAAGIGAGYGGGCDQVSGRRTASRYDTTCCVGGAAGTEWNGRLPCQPQMTPATDTTSHRHQLRHRADARIVLYNSPIRLADPCTPFSCPSSSVCRPPSTYPYPHGSATGPPAETMVQLEDDAAALAPEVAGRYAVRALGCRFFKSPR